MGKIDLNRGVIQQEDAKTGTAVFMYVDEPGVFYNAHGAEVPEGLARDANFNVDELLKEKKKRERLKKAQADIEADAGKSEGTSQVVAEKNGYQLVDIGYDRFVVKQDGKLITPQATTRENAQGLLDRLTVGLDEKRTQDATVNPKVPDQVPPKAPVVSGPGGPGPTNAPGDPATRAAADRPQPTTTLAKPKP